MALTDLQLLTTCANFTLAHAAEVEKEVHKQLQTSGATRLVNDLRMLRLQKAILAVGMFSLLEGLLQDRLGWKEPFQELDVHLNSGGHIKLASTIHDYYLAINVLKHGLGRSHTELMARQASLDFKITTTDKPFFEGDVSEVGVLVNADEKFVRRCAELIEQASALLPA